MLKQSKWSVLSGLAILIITAYLSYPRLATNTFHWDVFGYYLYLPATFIHHDVGLENREWLEEIQEKYHPSPTLYQASKHPNTQKHIIQYTSGMALLYLPFFLIAHWLTTLTGGDADGFTLLYQYFVNAGMFLYFAGALWALVKLCRNYFSDQMVAISLFLFFVGTNWIQIASEQLLSPHIGLFALYAFLLYFTDSFYRQPNLRKALILGFIVGAILLNRPTEIACLAIPLLWGLVGTRFSQRINWWKNHRKLLFYAIFASFLVGSLQLVYWAITTGKPIYMSYTNAGEGLDLLTPHIFEFLFSFRKGWLIYTPLAILIFVGVVIQRRKQSPFFWPSALVLLFSLYFMSSWTTWWYAGGSYSSRTMINVFPVLFLPFITVIDQARKSKQTQIAASLFVLPLASLNLFQFWQWRNEILHPTRMTRSYYITSFLATQKDPDWEKHLLIDRSLIREDKLPDHRTYSTVYEKKILFDSVTISTTVGTEPIKGFELNQEIEFSPNWEMPFNELTDQDHVWMKATATAYVPKESNGKTPLLTVMTIHKDAAYKYRSYSPVRTHPDYPELKIYELEYLSPELRRTDDKLRLVFWNQDREKVYAHSFTIEVLAPDKR